METVSVQVELPKETHELVQAIAKVVEACKKALADGAQPTDLVTVVPVAVKELGEAIKGAEMVPAEAKADPGKVVVALALALDQLL
jgi:hypothetical protein